MLNPKELEQSHFEFKKPTSSIISQDLENLRKKNEVIIIDARSPSEFKELHIPSSVNFPLLDDKERILIGTIYKQQNQKDAIAKGWKLFSKKINTFVNSITEFLKKNNTNNKQIVVYCARGGMRSGIITNLLEEIGFSPSRLEGGIKAYKNLIHEKIESLLNEFKGKLIILDGNTGTRKTELITSLKIPYIDLEGLAQHRASTYGSVNLTPRSQKDFVFHFYNEFTIVKDAKFIIVEGESRRIGNVFIPEKFWNFMTKGIHIQITATLKTRINAIIKEYCSSDSSVQQLIDLTPRLAKYMGAKNSNMIINDFKAGNFEKAVEFLLVNYYDNVYKVHKNTQYATTISTNDIKKASIELTNFVDTL